LGSETIAEGNKTAGIPLENRKKIKIYKVVKGLEPKNPNQMNILAA